MTMFATNDIQFHTLFKPKEWSQTNQQGQFYLVAVEV
jgi:hypothetical protein